MTKPAKILWGEGLFLRPQHFQQQDRYHEARLQQTAQSLHPYCWGLRHLELDREALKTDALRLLALSAVFPDGEAYNAPQDDTLPPAVRLDALPPTTQTIEYHIALPYLKPYGQNCADDDAPQSGARYGQAMRDTDDLYTQAPSAPLCYLHKRGLLLPAQDAAGAYTSLPLLRLRRVTSGGFETDPEFLPPCLSLAAAPALVLRLTQLLEKLLAKVNALYGHHREPSKNVIELRGGDVSSFWLLHTASAAYAALSHYARHPELHPERLYEQLLVLAGGLMTYSRQARLEDLPAYRHADPGPAFAQIDALIRNLLDTVISAKYFSIALASDKPCYYRGALDSGKIDQQTTLYLAVSADLPMLELVGVAPLRFKLGAPEDVDKFVLSAMPGVKLVHAPQVPAAIPVRPDTCYFALDSKGALYEAMLKAQAISIYVPSGLRDLQLELIGIAA